MEQQVTIASTRTEGKTITHKGRSGWSATTRFMTENGLKCWEVSTYKSDSTKKLFTNATEVDIKNERGYESVCYILHSARSITWRNDQVVTVNEKAITAFHNASLEKFRLLTDSEVSK